MSPRVRRFKFDRLFRGHESRSSRMNQRRLQFESLEHRQLLSASSFDTTFNTTGYSIMTAGQSDQANAVAVQSDGKIVVAGTVQTAANNSDVVVARYNPDGTLDTTFGTGGKVITDVSGTNDHGKAVAIQPDGKILVGGDTSLSGHVEFLLMRYNTNGTLDSTLGTGGIVVNILAVPQVGDETINAIAFDGNLNGGEIVAAGQANSQFTVAEYSTSGAFVADFSQDIGLAGDSAATSVVIDSQGRIVAGGYAQEIVTPTLNHVIDTQTLIPSPPVQDFVLVRLASSGQLDTSFGSKGITTTDFSDPASINALAVDDHGNIVAAGSSGSQVALARFIDNTMPTNGVIQAGSDGALDTTFNGTGTLVMPLRAAGGTDDALGVGVQDGRIVYAGVTTDPSSVDSKLLLNRLNPDGTVDATFNGGAPLALLLDSSTESGAEAMAIDANGRIVTAGFADGTLGQDGIAVARFGDAVSLEGQTLFLRGTAGNDTLMVQFTSPTAFNVTLNGVTTSYTTAFSANQVTSIVFHGGVGKDELIFQDTFNTLAAVFARSGKQIPANVSLFRQGFGYAGDGVETNYVYGIAADTATIAGLSNSTAVVTTGYTYLAGPNSATFDQVAGFDTVNATSNNGTGFVYSAFGATITSDDSLLTMQVPVPTGEIGLDTNSTFSLGRFENLYTQSSGSSSEKYIFQADGDNFVGTPTYAYVIRQNVVIEGAELPTYFHEAVGFHTVIATNGGTANLYDSAGADLFVGTAGYSYLSGGSGSSAYFNQVNGFQHVSASSSGGSDRAYLYGASAGDVSITGDTFISHSEFSQMTNSSTNLSTIAYGFAFVSASVGQGGATLYDAAGTNDLDIAGSSAQMDRVTAGTTAIASGFTSVAAIGTLGSDNHQSIAAHDFALTTLGNWQ